MVLVTWIILGAGISLVAGADAGASVVVVLLVMVPQLLPLLLLLWCTSS